MSEKQKITTMLWFDGNAEEAANFYASTFKDSKVVNVSRYPKSAEKASGRPAGSVMTVEFTLAGRNFVALNGGPAFKFNESISFVVNCDDQKELDQIFDRLSEGGDPKAQMCGWLKDKYGLSWQLVPASLPKLVAANPEGVMGAILTMKKLNIAQLEEAAGAAKR